MAVDGNYNPETENRFRPFYVRRDNEMRLFQDFWCIETAGWSIDQSPECVTLCPADSEAAVQISCHRKRTGDISIAELREFAHEHLPASTPSWVRRCGAFDGIVGEFTDHGTYWRNWWLGHGKTHLFVMYNCDEQVKGHHDDVVDWMLAALAAIESE